MRQFKTAFAAAVILTAGHAGSAAAMDGVVASIKPVHSLVAGVMGETGRPGLIVEGAGSPHTYSLKPSQARMLENAKLVFWVGPGLEAFLEKPLETLGGNAAVFELSKADGIALLNYREDDAFAGHDDDHDHDAHDGEHADEHASDGGHDHEEGGEHHADAGEEGQHHNHNGTDMHVWLDPRNASAMAQAIAGALAKADPANAETYRRNAEALTVKLKGLESEIAEALAPVRGKPFVVFHDGYRYFEKRFGLEAAGAVTVNPDVMPGAERIAELRKRIGELNSACVFAEPQFEPRILTAITEGTDVRSGTLDPLGASLPDGPDLYFALMHGMAASFRGCLAREG